jgi:inositol transport system substrate-binding protein
MIRTRLLAACAATLLTAAGSPAISPAVAKTVTIGVTLSRFEHLFLVKVHDSIQDEANALGNVQVQFEDAQGDVGRQLNQVQNFIAQGVDAIIVNAADTSATDGITKMVTQAGIPLVYVNLGPDLGSKLPPKVAVVVSDHVISGRLQMEGLVKCMHEKGNVAIMLGELASNATQERTAGNKEVIAKFPNIKVVLEQSANYQRNQAIDLMSNWISTGQKIDAVAANNDEMAIGAIFAIQQAGLSPQKYCIGGIDGTPDGLNEMKKGNLAVTVFQNAAAQGKGAVDAAVKLVNGEKVDPFVLIPYELVTPENMQNYMNRW